MNALNYRPQSVLARPWLASVRFLLLTSIPFFVGCGVVMDARVAEANARVQELPIGISRQEVMETIGPLQDLPIKDALKPPRTVLVDREHYDVVYVRTKRIADGLNTDEEFTPLIFKSGRLVSKGSAAESKLLESARIASLRKSFTTAEIALILGNHIAIGMSEEALVASLGAPINALRRVDGSGESKFLEFFRMDGPNVRVLVKNGQVVSFQE